MAQHLSLIDTDLKHVTVFEPHVIVRIAIDQAKQIGFTIFGDPRKESVHAQS